MLLEKELEGLKMREDWKFDTFAPYVHPPPPIVPTILLPAPGPFSHDWLTDVDEHLAEFRPPTPDNLHAAIRDAGNRIPRYLFRAWSAQSGGDARLNTSEAITALAFLDGGDDPPNDVFDIPPSRLSKLVRGHLHGGRVLTPFSSWSYSLPFALAMVSHMPDAYTSVIDTHQLNAENYVFHCGNLNIAFPGIDSFAEEFLVYGIVQGDAYRAVPRNQIQRYVASLCGQHADSQFYWSMHPHTQAARIQHARAFGKEFGAQFEFPMALCLLAARGKMAGATVAHAPLIKKLRVPQAWLTDLSFPSMPPRMDGYTHEAETASKAMTALAQKLQKTGRIPNIVLAAQDASNGDES